MTATAWMTLLIYGFILIDDLSAFYIYAPIYGFGYAGVMTGVLATVAAHTPPAQRGFAMGVVTMFGWEYYELPAWRQSNHQQYPPHLRGQAVAVALSIDRLLPRELGQVASMVTGAIDAALRQREATLF